MRYYAGFSQIGSQMLLKFPVILSGKSFIIHLLFPSQQVDGSLSKNQVPIS